MKFDARTFNAEAFRDALTKDVTHELWRRGILSWKLEEHQLEIYNLLLSVPPEDQSEILFLCSRQFGKSYMNLVMALEFAIRTPGIQVRIGAPTKDQAQEIIEANLVPIMRDAPPGLVKPARSEKTWRVSNGSSIKVGAMERSHVDSLRGPNSPLIILEEGVALYSDDYSHAVGVVAPQQTRHKDSRLIHVTSAPEDPEHYVLTEVLAKCMLKNTVFERTIYQNTALSADQIERIASKMPGGIKGEKFRREYLCEIIRTRSLVCVPEFDLKLDVAEFPEPEFANWTTCTDVGGVRDFSVPLLGFYNFAENTLCVWDERKFEANTESSQIVAEAIVMEDGRKSRRIADAAGQTRVDLRGLGFDVELPWKVDWEASLNKLRVEFTHRRVKIHPRCKFLIATLKGAIFNKHRTDFARSQTLGHMDALASLMYLNVSQDRSNPIPPESIDRTRQWQRPQPEENSDIAAALNPWRAKRR